MPKTLNVLHTSDWHLGRRLYGHARYDEFTQFLDWLYECLCTQAIDVLIVAGDIFDTMTPSNRAQQLYYQFLARIAQTQECPCRHVVIVAGNHDSPSLIDAPKHLLKQLNVHVIGSATDDIADEVITLTDANGNPQAIIMAVPYLRDRDVRVSFSAQSGEDKHTQLIAGIQAHYQHAHNIAKQRLAQCQQSYPSDTPPLIATGHLYASGAITTADDGVRELYIGTLGHINADIFDKDIDYVALGHLHVPQKVGGHEHIRYSGSPIPMGFGEAKQSKQVLKVSFIGQNPCITALVVPTFQRLTQIKGNLAHIKTELKKLVKDNQSIWVEVVYDGSDSVIQTNLNQQLNELVENSNIQLLKIFNQQSFDKILRQQGKQAVHLHELDEIEVFERCLQINAISDAERPALINCYQQILYEMRHEDAQAE